MTESSLNEKKAGLERKIDSVLSLLALELRKVDSTISAISLAVAGTASRREEKLLEECRIAKAEMMNALSTLNRCHELARQISVRNRGNTISGISEYRHGYDIFGNEIVWGPNGEEYRIGNDIFGNKTVWDPCGREIYRIGPDIFGNKTAWNKDGIDTYRIADDIVGNHTVWDADGKETYHFGKDIFGNGIIRDL